MRVFPKSAHTASAEVGKDGLVIRIFYEDALTLINALVVFVRASY